MILIIDNYDSFTYNLVDYFKQLGCDVEVLYNDDTNLLQKDISEFKAVVLSPGPKRPKDAGFLMQFIEQYFDKKPILGVCLGHQALGEFFGANLVLAKEPMHGRTSKIYFDLNAHNPLYKNLMPGVKMMRYHSLILENENIKDLHFTSHTLEQEVMSLQHAHLPLYGVQFHPESILSTYGILILRNWLDEIKYFD